MSKKNKMEKYEEHELYLRERMFNQCKEAGIDMSNYKDEVRGRDKFSFCFCHCHTDGLALKHVVACCSLCYDKYINNNGQLDTDRLKLLIADRKRKVDVEIARKKPMSQRKMERREWITNSGMND